MAQNKCLNWDDGEDGKVHRIADEAAKPCDDEVVGVIGAGGAEALQLETRE